MALAVPAIKQSVVFLVLATNILDRTWYGILAARARHKLAVLQNQARRQHAITDRVGALRYGWLSNKAGRRKSLASRREIQGSACSKDGEQFSDHVLPAMYDLYPGACTRVPSVPKDHPHEATGDFGDLGDLGDLRARSRRWRPAGGLRI